MNLNEIIAKIEDARMQYAEAQVRHFHVAEEKQRYANLLINYAPELLAASRKFMEAEAAALTQTEMKVNVTEASDVKIAPSARKKD